LKVVFLYDGVFYEVMLSSWMHSVKKLGVSVDVADHKGCTPLIVASQYGQTMLAGYLMGKSAQLFLADREGDTALHWAAFKGT
jgi:ankyrin repeat protein